MGNLIIIMVDIVTLTFIYCSTKISSDVSKEEEIEEIKNLIKKLKY